jgi:MoxR-like ATPase
MFEKLMRLYAMAMAYDVRSPMPHLVGPPGSGKSSVIEELAQLLGVEMHIINVSRLSPLEIEGVQMPHGMDDAMALRMLTATFWTSLKAGDILLMDEFLRGFPEVYNGLLDIFTSRRVGAYRLPKVFIIGASNSVVAYDHALEDRLLHIPVTDPRTNAKERGRLAQILIDQIGLYQKVHDSQEMTELLSQHVLPTYDILDAFKKKGNKAKGEQQGVSIRNLIGQAQLKLVKTTELRALIEYNNVIAMNDSKAQYVVLLDGRKDVPHLYEALAAKLRGNKRLTPVQALNVEMNLQLISMQDAAMEKETV